MSLHSECSLIVGRVLSVRCVRQAPMSLDPRRCTRTSQRDSSAFECRMNENGPLADPPDPQTQGSSDMRHSSMTIVQYKVDTEPCPRNILACPSRSCGSSVHIPRQLYGSPRSRPRPILLSSSPPQAGSAGSCRGRRYAFALPEGRVIRAQRSWSTTNRYGEPPVPSGIYSTVCIVP